MKKNDETKHSINLRRIKDFSLDLPERGLKKGERLTGKTTTTDRILAGTSGNRDAYERGLHELIGKAFPKMPPKELDEYVEDYFTPGEENYHRQAVLLFNETGKIVATGLFDQGRIKYKSKNYTGIYGIMRAADPEYTGFGLTQAINEKVVCELQPDLVLGNCYHSGAIHAWLSLFKQGRLADYEIYPRTERIGNEDVLILPSPSDFDFAIGAFRQMNMWLNKNREIVDNAAKNITSGMITKNTHCGVYDYNPWGKNNREDSLAKALGVTERDGILVMVKKPGIIFE